MLSIKDTENKTLIKRHVVKSNQRFNQDQLETAQRNLILLSLHFNVGRVMKKIRNTLDKDVALKKKKAQIKIKARTSLQTYSKEDFFQYFLVK